MGEPKKEITERETGESLLTPASAGGPREPQSHTLASIIKSARMIIVAPLVAGAYQIPTLISTAQYSTALKCAVVSGASFLILASALRIADIITGVRRIDNV